MLAIARTWVNRIVGREPDELRSEPRPTPAIYLGVVRESSRKSLRGSASAKPGPICFLSREFCLWIERGHRYTPPFNERQYEDHFHQRRSLAHFSHHGGIRRFLRNTFPTRSRRYHLRLGADSARRSLLPNGRGTGQRIGQEQTRGHHRRWTRHHGSGQ